MKNIESKLKPIFNSIKEESRVGLIKFNISVSGNHEPDEFDLTRSITNAGFNDEIITEKVTVIYDGETFSKIFIECYNAETFVEHFREVKNKNKKLSIALNEAITMIDDYNNMHGDTMNKTEILIKLDEVLKNNQ